jgi:hypothetical protein
LAVKNIILSVIGDKNMWKENLIALKNKSGKTFKEIEEATKIPERSLVRIFSTKKDDIKRGHSISTIIPIVNFLNGSLDEVFADTNAIVGGKAFIELQEKIKSLVAEKELLANEKATVTAERDFALADNAILKDEIKSLTAKVDLLTMQLSYKDEIIALYKIIEQSKK